MEREKLCPDDMIRIYRPEVEKLLVFLPWLKEKRGKEVGRNYMNEQMADFTMSIPVYDSTLLTFVRAALDSGMMDKNYAYVYSRYRMKDIEDEQKMIRVSTLQTFDILKGILSHYILKGITKGSVWREGVESGILADVILKMKELIEYWDKPFR